jgi:hypothetical protein
MNQHMAQMMGQLLGQPKGRVLRLRYTRKALPSEHPSSAPAAVSTGATFSAATGDDVLEVTFASPNGEETTHLMNEGYNPQVPALMFMGAIGVKPTDFDGKTLDVSDDGVIVPLVYDQNRDQYGIHGKVLERGQKALIDASWNSWDESMANMVSSEESDSDDSDSTDDDGIDVEVR